VADDFTGANDACGRLADLGYRAYASLDRDEPRGHWEVLAFNARSRFLDRPGALSASKSAWEKLLSSGFHLEACFQKIDSTLRGFPSQEIRGMLETTGSRFALVVPAYPALERVTLGGRHYVQGRPLAGSEYAQDAVTPSECTRVDRLFKRGESVHVPMSVVARGPQAMARFLRTGLAASAPSFFSFDAQKTRDLEAIVQAGLDLGCRAWAGASGLAAALGAALAGRPARRTPDLPPVAKVLVLAGSISQTTLDQCRSLEKSGLARWAAMSGPEQDDAWPKDRSVLVLSSVKKRSEAVSFRKACVRKGMDRFQAAEEAMQALANRARKLVPRRSLVLLTGGHMAEAFYGTQGYRGNWIQGQLALGLPFGRAVGPDRASQWVATKPGGFGREGDLTSALKKILVN
jgi:uncharacterized protein YgbK (DUF1537 family)